MSEARVPAGLHKRLRTVRSRPRAYGQSAGANNPAPLSPLLIVTRMGRDYRPGPRSG